MKHKVFSSVNTFTTLNFARFLLKQVSGAISKCQSKRTAYLNTFKNLVNKENSRIITITLIICIY